MRKSGIWLLLALVVAALALVAAGCGGDDDDDDGGAAAPDTTATDDGTMEPVERTASIGIMGPFTGDVAAIGQEQLNWAKFAVDQFNTEHGTTFSLVEGDTQLDPAQAATVAPQFVSNSDIIAVVGPAGSQEIEAVGTIYGDETMAFISPSATQTDLTENFETFFRVVPTDADQGPTDAAYMADQLGAQNVLIIDDQTSLLDRPRRLDGHGPRGRRRDRRAGVRQPGPDGLLRARDRAWPTTRTSSSCRGRSPPTPSSSATSSRSRARTRSSSGRTASSRLTTSRSPAPTSRRSLPTSRGWTTRRSRSSSTAFEARSTATSARSVSPTFAATTVVMEAAMALCAAGRGADPRGDGRQMQQTNLPESIWAADRLHGHRRHRGRDVLHLPGAGRRELHARRVVRENPGSKPCGSCGGRTADPGIDGQLMDFFVQQLVNGVTLGSVYALIALGYSMVYGILKLLNFAHGEVYMIGAFIGYFVLTALGGAPRRCSRWPRS